MRVSAIDLAADLLRRSVRANLAAPCCAACGRRPLPGELVHVFEGGRSLCTLCAGALPAEMRVPLRSERIHVRERQLAVGPRAA
jgi:hypothetical protein